MRLSVLLGVLGLAATANAGVAQPAEPSKFTDAVQLLQAVSRTYAAPAETFHMEAIEETEQNDALQHSWRKELMSATKGTGNRYRIEVKASMGSWLEVSDGKQEWRLLEQANKYVVKPTPQNGPELSPVYVAGNSEVFAAWRWREELESQAAQYKHAVMEGSATLKLDGHRFDCYVVHVTSADAAHTNMGLNWDETAWIDKKALVFRKRVRHSEGYLIVTPTVHVPVVQTLTMTYPVVDLHPPLTQDIFAYTPPAGAEQVAALEPDVHSFQSSMKPQLLGKAAPDAVFPTSDGKGVELKSYRGRPVLIDVWATWCGPCLLAMPGLGKLYATVKDKMTFVSVDQDGDASIASSYLSRHGYAWTNFHDPQGTVEKALNGEGVPLTVLIDAQGKIVFYSIGPDETGLRKAIAGLGPEFASVMNAPTAKLEVAPGASQ
jgi:thiol-disulfide isomerase/thioredoxin